MTHYLIQKVPVTHCADCAREFDTEVKYGRGGLCSGCESRHRRNVAAPRRRRNIPLSTVLAEYEFMRDTGVSLGEMPRQLGMSREAFARALIRGRSAGDSRAQSFRGMGR